MVAGVAGGLGPRLGLEPAVLRLAFVVMTVAGGAGVVLYLIAWLVSGEEEGEEAPQEPMRAPSSPMRRVFALGLVVAGLLLLLRETTLWPGDAVMWSVGLGAFGSAILWTKGEDPTAGRLARFASHLPAAPAQALAGLSRAKLALGAVLVIAGMATLLVANTSVETVRNLVFAVTVTIAGLAFILGPWISQLVRQLRAERHERIRSEERAEVAAHLHDSVLQTLALIQRSQTPKEMASLARVQERDLRAWLYGRATQTAGGARMVSGALDEMAGRIERLHRVVVESVVVGDAAMDVPLQALVDAAGEAMTNAAKHAEVDVISVYCEVDEAEVTVYVRDEGRGFDAERRVPDRRGIAGSIIDRIERNGGVAAIRSKPSEGTEVHLVMPRKP